jgi:hypothetical protein
MGPRAIVLLLSLALPACASDPAATEEASPERSWNRPAAYAGLGIGFVQGGLPRPRSAFTEAVRGGYRIGPRTSAEASVEHSEADAGFGGVSINIWKLTKVGAVGKLHLLEGRFQPHLLVGGGWYRFHREDTTSGAYWRVGAGFEWNFGRRVALYGMGAWDEPIGSHRDLNHVSAQLGLLFRF